MRNAQPTFMLSEVNLDAMQKNWRATRGFACRKAVCEHKHIEMDVREWMMVKTVLILAALITLDCCDAHFE